MTPAKNGLTRAGLERARHGGVVGAGRACNGGVAAVHIALDLLRLGAAAVDLWSQEVHTRVVARGSADRLCFACELWCRREGSCLAVIAAPCAVPGSQPRRRACLRPHHGDQLVSGGELGVEGAAGATQWPADGVVGALLRPLVWADGRARPWGCAGLPGQRITMAAGRMWREGTARRVGLRRRRSSSRGSRLAGPVSGDAGRREVRLCGTCARRR
jgi:hypothetical protein